MAGAKFAMQRRNVLIADEPGLGKTIQSIAAVVGSKTRGTILVVAPKTAAHVTWPSELKRWLSDVSPDDPIHVIGSRLDKRQRLGLLRKIIAWEMNHDPYLVVDPNTLPQRQWVIVSPNYLRFKFQVNDSDNFVYDDDGEKIILPVREALKPLLGIQYAGIIVDEAHETLAGATGNIKKQSAQSRGLRLLEVREDGLRIALSGTPFRGKHENLWGVLNWVDPEEYNHLRGDNTYWDWIHRHFRVYHDDVFNQDIIGNLRSERDLASEAKKYMIRRTKKKVLPELPEKFYGGTPLYPKKKPPEELTDSVAKFARIVVADPKDIYAKQSHEAAMQKVASWYDKNNPIAVWLPIDGQQKKAYDQMKREAMADFENGTLLANSLLAEMTRLKQFANSYGRLDAKDNYSPQLPSNKFEWLLQFLRERGIDGPDPSGSRVVVGSQFTRHINLFARELKEHYKIPVFVLTGATSAEDRLRQQEAFQSGKMPNGKTSPEVFLGNTRAMGLSINLDAADDLVVLDSTHNSDDQVQLEDRIHRISRIHSVSIWNVVSKGTIDEQILKATRKTGRSLKRILDSPDAAMSLLDS